MFHVHLFSEDPALKIQIRTQSYPSIPRLTPKLAREIAEANLYIQCTMGAS